MPYAWILALAMMQEPTNGSSLTWQVPQDLANYEIILPLVNPKEGETMICGPMQARKMSCVVAEPIDVPAVERKRDDPTIDYGIDCGGGMGLCEAFYQAQRWYCTDPSRFLIGPNGKGEYICHKAQLEPQP